MNRQAEIRDCRSCQKWTLSIFVTVAVCCLAAGCWMADSHFAGGSVGLDSSANRVAPRIDNFLKITDRIYTGGEPQQESVFADLAALGIRTLVSVDGARPDIDLAHKHALRYVHIPIGYDGIDAEAGLSLARLARDAEAPFYIHCHHGKHRGPAAAAVIGLTTGEVDQDSARDILERAGTGKEYVGLWKAVEGYEVPAKGTELPDLVEVAELDSLVVAMDQIERAFDNLELCREAGWSSPPSHPDLIPHHQALLLKEGFRESIRHLSEKTDLQFFHLISAAESATQQVQDALAANELESATRSIRELSRSCTQCHEQFRNGKQVATYSTWFRD